MNHQYITCTGFGRTGSSVISDFLGEFDTVKCGGAGFEMNLAFDLGGISDLQHYMIDDFERNKTPAGIFLFRKLIKQKSKEYSQYFGKGFVDIMEDYIDKLIQLSWQGQSQCHYYRYNSFQRFWFYALPFSIERRYRVFLPKKDSYERTPRMKHLLPIELGSDKELFFEATRNMFAKLLDSFDPTNSFQYLCFDQLVPAYNFKRYHQYFPNLKTIVIDRDPRDLYLLNRLYWQEGWIPTDTELFIKWYKLLRKQLNNDLNNAQNVILLQFEDFIYDYEETKERLLHFLKLDGNMHVRKRELFNPDISIKNTRHWEVTNQYHDSIIRIEKELKQFCYEYNDIGVVSQK